MEVQPRRPTVKGPADWFTGDVWIDTIAQGQGPMTIGFVHFTPGARTAWHSHGIAQTLHVSPSTVRTHVRNSMTKLGAHTRAQLVAVAMEGHKPLEMGRTDDGTPSKSST